MIHTQTGKLKMSKVNSKDDFVSNNESIKKRADMSRQMTRKRIIRGSKVKNKIKKMKEDAEFIHELGKHYSGKSPLEYFKVDDAFFYIHSANKYHFTLQYISSGRINK